VICSSTFLIPFPMSSPLKRRTPDDGPRLGPSTSSCLQISNSVPCGDPRCEVRACLTGPFTTLYFYPPFSEAEIVAEVIISHLGCFFVLTGSLVRQSLSHRRTSRLESLLPRQLCCPSSASTFTPHDVRRQLDGQ
jgi:hypothetical protein